MSLQLYQKLTDGPIMRNGIRHRDDSFEPENTFFITFHDGAPLGIFTVGILYVVMACGVSFPDVDFSAFNGMAGGVFDGGED